MRRGMRTLFGLAGCLVLGAPFGLAAQDAPPPAPPTALLASGPEIGERAPDFSLPSATKDGVAEGPLWSLSAQRGRVVVLAFYPKDFTTGCTAEMRSFTERFGELFGDGVIVVGVNADSLETHVRFAQSLSLSFPLLTDLDQKVSGRYGSADANGYNRRTIYVIDPRGRVSYVDRRFGPLDPGSYSRLKAAVRSARRDG
jgi:thioredoxin-dependent peroxiredoxin